jgi:prolyl oligopeptidase
MVISFKRYGLGSALGTCALGVLLGLGASFSMKAHSQGPGEAAQDPFLWLEEVQGERALNWVRERNALSRQQLQTPLHATLREQIREVLDSRDRIPEVSRRGEHFYNLWRDAQNPRGLWRRTSFAEYRKAQPQWETVLDLDALGKAEGQSWVWGGATCLAPQYRRCLLRLSPGGSDAVVVREFDTQTKQFVAGGFELPLAKSQVDWLDENTLFVGTDFGPGSLTSSGYARVIKRWQRGQALAQAVTVFEGKPEDVAAFAWVDDTVGHARHGFGRSIGFYSSEMVLQQASGALKPLLKPEDANLNFWYGRVLLELRSPWKTGGTEWPKGSLLVADYKAFVSGKARWQALFTPTASRSLASYTVTRSTVLLSILDNVASRLEERRFAQGRWQARVVKTPSVGTLSTRAWHDTALAQDSMAEAYTLRYADFLTPDTVYEARSGSDARTVLKSRPSFFNSQGMRAEQFFASSKDGTRVPYFVVWGKDAKADGKNPTLLYGYGGFENVEQPWYSGSIGRTWLERGGVYVVANIRGGGEYGPGWHQAALREKRQNAFDDFAAVAEDLIRRQVTNPRQLGIQGGSNGGLLVGAVMLQRPELFGAVLCQVPLLDMARYHQLLAGASWMAEYGDPSKPEDWAFLSRYSPYQNVKPGQKLPALLLTTSTKDDRVHPGHARKMAARMLEQGHRVLYYENIEGGHGGAADNAQRADMMALEYSFLWQQLKPGS